MKKGEKLELIEIQLSPFLHISLSIAIYKIHYSLYTMGLRKQSRKDKILNMVISYFVRKYILGVSVITYLLGSLGNNKDEETVLYTN